MDEYEHDNSRAAIHIFSKDTKNRCRIEECLKKCGFSPNFHSIDTKKLVLEELKQLSTKSDFSNNTSLIVIILAQTKKHGWILPDKETSKENAVEIKEIYSPFIQTASLFDKPKLFIIQTVDIPEDVQIDRVVKRSRFDVPLQADLIIVYKHLQEHKENSFVNFICENLENRKKKDDVVDIFSSGNCVIFSTATKNFYLASNGPRGYLHELGTDIHDIDGMIDNLDSKLSQKMLKPKRPVSMGAAPKVVVKKPVSKAMGSRPPWKY